MNKLLILTFAVAGIALAQINTLTQTSLSAAITGSDQTFKLASTTGITSSPPTLLYVDNEAMYVTSVGSPAAGYVQVVRGQQATGSVGHISGAMVLAGRPDWFYTGDPSGSCVVANVYASPYVNMRTGRQFLCSSVLLKWVAGYNNLERPPEVTTAVASNAGLITPTGPLFHVTGSNVAVTGFTVPVGFERGTICAIPDTVFTTTNATNFGVASTAVVAKTLCWTYDSNTAKFYPSY